MKLHKIALSALFAATLAFTGLAANADDHHHCMNGKEAACCKADTKCMETCKDHKTCCTKDHVCQMKDGGKTCCGSSCEMPKK
jgi:hypothetical protein